MYLQTTIFIGWTTYRETIIQVTWIFKKKKKVCGLLYQVPQLSQVSADGVKDPKHDVDEGWIKFWRVGRVAVQWKDL